MRKIKLLNIKKALRFNVQSQPKMALGVTYADRKSWWTNDNADLVNRISEIKRAQS